MNLNIWCTWGEGEGLGGGGQMNILNYETNKLNNVYYKGENILSFYGGNIKNDSLRLCIVYYDVKVVRTVVQNNKFFPQNVNHWPLSC